MLQTIRTVRECWRRQRREAWAGCLPTWRQFVEMCLLYGLRSIGPGYYVTARWWRRDIPFADKWAHVNRREYRRLVGRLNPMAYRKASQHKFLEKAVLQAAGIPTPEFLGFVHHAQGCDRRGCRLASPEALRALLAELDGQRVCFKRIEGHDGFGFASYRVRCSGGEVRLAPGRGGAELSPEQWWRLSGEDPDGYLLERYFEQHPVMAGFNASSANTLRVWVCRRGDDCRVLGAHLRVGRGGSEVDNINSGGFYGIIEPESGLCRAAYDSRSLTAYAVHPDTGEPLVPQVLPYWPECLELARRALRAFPHMLLAGADVAVGPEGPVIIELNVVPGYLGCARMDLPLKRVLRELGLW